MDGTGMGCITPVLINQVAASWRARCSRAPYSGGRPTAEVHHLTLQVVHSSRELMGTGVLIGRRQADHRELPVVIGRSLGPLLVCHGLVLLEVRSTGRQ